MLELGYHASHEQFTPRDLLRYVQRAEAAGFTCAMSSDHFHPWTERQGQSGFAWSWLGAALQATTFPVGVISVPGWRYHPAILAQASATLAQMYPDRFWMALGSGEALNEHITGQMWPEKAIRNAVLRESAEVIRALWRGETVTFDGHVKVTGAKLYMRPEHPPRLLGAAVTAETAGWVGEWADGLLTVTQSREELTKVVESFRRGGGEGKPMFLQVHVSYAEDDETALAGAYDQWRCNVFNSLILGNLATPAEFEAVGEFVRPEDLHGPVRISSDPQRHIEWLREDLEMGFSHIYIHNVNVWQEPFIDVFGEQVLPALRD